MTYENLIWIVLAIALILWIGFRQLAWQSISERAVWTMPVVLILIGLVSGTSQLKDVRPDATSLGLLGVEAVLSLGIGATMGAIARFRQAPGGTVDKRGAAVRWQTRTGWLGLGLWAAMIAVRIGIDAAATIGHVGGGLLTSSAVILALLGLNRLARSAVLQSRLGRLGGVAAA